MRRRFERFWIAKAISKILVALSYLVEIVNSVPTSANAEYYAKIVAEKAMLRRLISKLTESVNQAYETSKPADEIIAQAEKGLIDVSENANRSGFKNIEIF